MVWLKRRWSPLKENRLQTLIDDGGVKGVWLLERYLGEQTRGLEDEQAELLRAELLEALKDAIVDSGASQTFVTKAVRLLNEGRKIWMRNPEWNRAGKSSFSRIKYWGIPSP